MSKTVLHKRSVVVENNRPKLPTSAQMQYGEIAINYATGHETLTIKNFANEIISFSSDPQVQEKIDYAVGNRVSAVTLNGSALTITNGLVNLGNLLGEEEELVFAEALNDLNSRLVTVSGMVENLDIEELLANYHGNTGNTFSASTFYGNFDGPTGNFSTAISAGTMYENGTSLSEKYQAVGNYAMSTGSTVISFNASEFIENGTTISQKYAALHGNSGNSFSASTFNGNLDGATAKLSTGVSAATVSATTITADTSIESSSISATTSLYGATIYENGTSLVNKYQAKGDYAAEHGDSGKTFSASTFYGNIDWGSVTSKPTTFSGYGLNVQGDNKYTSASTAGAAAITVSGITKPLSSSTSTNSALADSYDAKAYVENYVANAMTSSVSYKGTTSTYAVAAKVGDMYIASAGFTIPSGQSANGAATTVESGDYIICRTSGTTTTSKWDAVEKNLTNAVTYSSAMSNGEVVVATGAGTITSQALSATTVGNATKINGYNLSVVTSTSQMTDPNTIYILQ